MQVGYGQLTSQVLITVGSFAGWGVKLSGQSLQIAGGGGGGALGGSTIFKSGGK